MGAYTGSIILFFTYGGFFGYPGLHDIPIMIFVLPWDWLESTLPRSWIPNDLGIEICISLIMSLILDLALVYALLFLFRVVHTRWNKSN